MKVNFQKLCRHSFPPKFCCQGERLKEKRTFTSERGGKGRRTRRIKVMITKVTRVVSKVTVEWNLSSKMLVAQRSEMLGGKRVDKRIELPKEGDSL